MKRVCRVFIQATCSSQHSHCGIRLFRSTWMRWRCCGCCCCWYHYNCCCCRCCGCCSLFWICITQTYVLTLRRRYRRYQLITIRIRSCTCMRDALVTVSMDICGMYVYIGTNVWCVDTRSPSRYALIHYDMVYPNENSNESKAKQKTKPAFLTFLVLSSFSYFQPAVCLLLYRMILLELLAPLVAFQNFGLSWSFNLSTSRRQPYQKQRTHTLILFHVSIFHLSWIFPRADRFYSCCCCCCFHPNSRAYLVKWYFNVNTHLSCVFFYSNAAIYVIFV